MSYPKFDQVKDPEDVCDFSVDFSGVIGTGDAINSVVNVDIEVEKAGPASTSPDVTMMSSLYTGTFAVMWLAGGKPGWRYALGVLVQTAMGCTFRRRILLDVRLQ